MVPNMAGVLSPNEAAQLAQTIEMFEMITQSQPADYQSLEILKEAYSKLGREEDVIRTSKRIAKAYMRLGQLSSAILEYETILQRAPDDAEVQAALREIEAKAGGFHPSARVHEPEQAARQVKPAAPAALAAPAVAKAPAAVVTPSIVDDGRTEMYKAFVESKLIAPSDFEQSWPTPDLKAPSNSVVEPFIQVLHDKKLVPIEKSLTLLVERARVGFLPIERYDVDFDLARTFPAQTCMRWCVLPFDKMSRTTFVATANPFNRQALLELSAGKTTRLAWYLTTPVELIKCIRKAFRV